MGIRHVYIDLYAAAVAVAAVMVVRHFRFVDRVWFYEIIK